MKNSYFIFWVLLCAAAFATAQQTVNVSKTDAANLVLNKILATDVGKVDMFISKSPISSTAGLSLPRKIIRCPYTSNWVVFVDDNVFANWEHPCRYVFINSETSEFHIINDVIFPENMGDFESISAMKRPEPKLFKSAPMGKPTVQTVTTNPHCYAVIINGGKNPDNNKPRYWNDISAIYCTVTQVYGYPPGNIYVHSTDGTLANNRSLDLDNDGNPDIKYPASFSTISSTFQTLANKIGPDDQLFVFVTDHGGRDANGSYVYLWGTDILRTSDLKNMLAPINASEIIVVMEQCYSGGFITDATNITGPHRVIVTACGSTELSYEEDWIAGGNYDEFTFYWTAAARGYYPGLPSSEAGLRSSEGINSTPVAPWNTSYAVGSFPFTPHYFSSHPADYNPDLDGDGIVGMHEAFDYANNFDTWSSYEYYYRYDNTKPPETPTPSLSIGFQEDLLALNGISGSFTTSQTVAGNFLVNGNLTVQSGVTVTINPSSSFYFTNSTSLIANGALVANGVSSQPITFTSSNATPVPGDWNTIALNGGPNTLTYCNINYATNAVTINNTSTSTLQNCKPQNNYACGLLVITASTSQNSVKVADCSISSNLAGIDGQQGRIDVSQTSGSYGINGNGNGIVLYQGANVYLNQAYVTGNSSAGVWLSGPTSYATFSPNGISPGYNHVETNTLQQIYVSSGGAYLGEVRWRNVCVCPGQSPSGFGPLSPSCPPPCYWQQQSTNYAGYNYVKGTNPWVNNYTSTTVKAELTYWGQAPYECPPLNPTHEFFGPVDYTNCLTGGGSVAAMGNAGGTEVPLSTVGGTHSNHENGIGATDDSVFVGRIQDLRSQIEKDPDASLDALRLLATLVGPGRRWSYALGVSWDDFLTQVTSASSSARLKSLVTEFQIQSKMDQRDFDGVITLANKVFQSHPADDVWLQCQLQSIWALAEKGDIVDARARFNTTRNRGFAIDSMSTAHLGQCLDVVARIGTPASATPQPAFEEHATPGNAKPTSFGMSQSYPNPFNPISRISYNLPTDAYVVLKVYDVIGREVAVLVNSYQEAGLRSVEFNASSLPSGVYFYHLQAGNFSDVKKMLLMK